MDWLKTLFGKKAPVIAKVPLSPQDEGRTAYGDQILRKAWAEKLLRGEGVPVNAHLPMIESEAEVTVRSVKDVANRLQALVLVAAKGEGLEHDIVHRIAADLRANKHFTPAERVFIDTPEPDMHSRTQFCWRYEAAWVLAWALRHIQDKESLGPPRHICDPAFLANLIHDTRDLSRRGLRSTNDILNEADLVYRCHWAVRQARIDGQDPPAGLDAGVVMERHHALNWLIGYNDGAAWDDVTTDT